MNGSSKDRRKYTRIALQLKAELKLAGNNIYHGRTKNISFGGVFVFCNNAAGIPVGEEASLTLVLDSRSHRSEIAFRCEIVRTDETGVGVKFISVDINGYQQFKNLMVFNSSDPDVLLAELDKHPGLVIQ
jgi:c-di-GMP-binding flagellar brake protein YcgR